MNQPVRIPPKNSCAYKAGAHLYEHGPMDDALLFAVIHFGTRKHVMIDRLNDAINLGWLRRTGAGQVALTEGAAQYYADAPEPASRPEGQVAGPRIINVMHRPPLSKRHIPNSRGIRTDVPAWSVREKTSFHKA